MNLDLDIDEVLTTTRAVRRRLDLERPVSREVVEECLRLAFQAPNGANEQDWVWVLVDDPETRRAMADLYRAGHAEHRRLHAGSKPSSPLYLVERLWRGSVGAGCSPRRVGLYPPVT